MRSLKFINISSAALAFRAFSMENDKLPINDV